MPQNESSLKQFQTRFKESMLRPKSNIAQVDQDFVDLFEQNNIGIHDRLEVYHNNIVGSLSSALCATFPLIENLVGEEYLRSLAREFVFKHPPQNGCLHFYGYGFDEFIKNQPIADKLPYLTAVATFELAINRAYYAEDDTPLNTDSLSQIPPEGLGDITLPLRLSSTLILSSYPLQDIKALCEGEHDETLDLKNKKDCYLLVNRPQFDVQITPLAEDEYHTLHSLNLGKPLGNAVEAALEQFPSFDFQSFLQKHIALETFSALSTNKSA